MTHTPGLVDARAAALATAFRAVETTRMAGLPLLHPQLRVEAVDFQREAAEPSIALGVLLTPWFMNLMRLPLDTASEQALAAVGVRCTRRVAALDLDFLGAEEAAFGRFESCSLFSPMHAFADQAAALATAREVLAQLRATAVTTTPPAAPVPDRRAFLFGRRTAAEQTRS